MTEFLTNKKYENNDDLNEEESENNIEKTEENDDENNENDQNGLKIELKKYSDDKNVYLSKNEINKEEKMEEIRIRTENNDKNVNSSEKVINKEEIMEDIPVGTDNNIGESNIVTSKSADLSVRVRSFKDWGYNTFMRTKQKVKERLSQTSRTVDLDLEDKIDMIKLQQTQYRMMLNNNYRMAEQLKQNIVIHQYSARMFSELSQTDKFLSETFLSQSQCETMAAGHFKELIDKLTISTTTLETLVTKTYDDMLLGIDAFETARVEYDAFKTETVKLVSQVQHKNSSPSEADQLKLQDMQERLEQKREKYEMSKASVLVKLNLLEDNKIRVIQREILNFRHAWFMLHSSCVELYSGTQRVTSVVQPVSDNIEVRAPSVRGSVGEES